MPRPNGERIDYRVITVAAERLDFAECPICLSTASSTREHVPPEKIGGRFMTWTCELCNHAFGSRFEPHLQTWYESSLGKVAVSGPSVRGHRYAGEFLVRQAPDGQFVLFQKGQASPELHNSGDSG